MSQLRGFASLALVGTLALACATEAQVTLRLHPENPRYFEWRGRPLVIVGSGEHYGAVLNGAFDFEKYLATLGQEGMNHTRLFTGATYIEPPDAFNIARNTLAPDGEAYVAPWARSDQPGYAGGGNRFDLERWNDAYFQRLRSFVAEAGRRGIIVEVNLFCPFYAEAQWRLSPFHPENHINGVGRGVARADVYTLNRHGGLLTYQERFVRRAVAELRQFDNFYYEVCNEPYAGNLPQDWQTFIASVIADAQAAHPDPKLIAQNIANHQAKVEQALPHVDLYNFHYAAPPDTVQMNWHLQRPIGDNETGFRGTNDAPYRMEAWDFIVAGGSLFSHLDYSFVVGHEDGTFTYPSSQPGGGNAALRRSFRALRSFIEGFAFLRMQPQDAVVTGGVPDSHTARALTEGDRAVAVYLRPRPTAQYSVRWTGLIELPETAEYTFHAQSNDGMRVWLKDQLVIDRWVEQGDTEHAGSIRLEAGRYPIKVEYFYSGGMASAKLAWSRPGSPKEPIPATAFRLPDDGPPGLLGEYFTGREFDRTWQTRRDSRIDFTWGRQSPFPGPDGARPVVLELDVAEGAWRAEWIDPKTGDVMKEERVRRPAGQTSLRLEAPPFREDIALRVTRR